MFPALGSTARQCDPLSTSILEAPCSMPCSTYQEPYASTSLHNDSIRTMPRHKSLPSVNPTMYSTESSPRARYGNIKRSDSTKSLRRSVPGMKSLLPLKLSSSLPPSTRNSPVSIRKSTLGFQEPEDSLTSQRPHSSPRGRHQVPRPITIRREQYRDIPIYTEPGSPLLNLAYYTNEEVCHNSQGDSFDEPPIIHRYAKSNDDGEEDLAERPLPEGPSSLRRNRLFRNSDLSFKRLGEPGELCDSLFANEGAWLSSPLNRWNGPKVEFLPQLLAENMPEEHDIEGWLSDTSSICDGGDNSYACATALAPARAHVVDVNTSRLSRLTIKIPPRSSSLVGTRPQSLVRDSGRKSRMTFRDSSGLDSDPFDLWNEDDVFNDVRPGPSQPPLPNNLNDLAMSPPLSPVQHGSLSKNQAAIGQRKSIDRQAHPKDFFLPQSLGQNSVSQIISDLDEATSGFPSKSLLPDTPCVSAIRVHLQQPASLLLSEMAVPPPLSSPFSQGVDWRPRPNPPKSDDRPKTSYFTSLQRTFSTRTSKTVPVSQNDWKHPTLDVIDTPPRLQHDPHNPTEPNLQPLNAIFPTAPQHLHSSLYAHILAYNFLTALPDQYSVLEIDTPPPSPLHLPFFTTASQSLPDKAADRLGIPASPTILRRISVGDDAVVLRRPGTGSGAGSLIHRMRQHIEWLISEMNGNVKGTEGERKEIDQSFLRALGEVVKCCERDCFGAT